MTLDFFLNSGTSQEAVIQVRFYNFGKRIKTTTKIKILRSLWNDRKGQPKGNSPEGIRIRKKLEDLEEHLAIFNAQERTTDELKDEIHRVLGLGAVKEGFFSYWEEYINEVDKRNTSENYRKRITSSKNLFKRYAIQTGTEFNFSRINQRLIDRFGDYLFKQDYAPSSVGKAIGHLKSFMSWARKEGLHNSEKWEELQKPKKQAKEITFLHQDEIRILEGANLPERLQRVVDLFLVGCFTGLRYSDLVRLTPSNIGEEFITIRATKDMDRLAIPISSRLKRILEKYPEGLPVVSNQKGNDYLKEAVVYIREQDPELLTREILVSKYKRGRPADEFLKIEEIISWHMARRTFITLSLEAGMSSDVIMKFTGHSDHQALKPYLEATEKLKNEAFLKAWG